MNSFPIQTIESAPQDSKPVLQTLQASFGFVPNIAGAMANSPTLINGFIGLFQRVHAGTFNEPEIQTVLLTDAVVNRSPWPVAFHTALALQQGVSPADVQAMRESRAPQDKRLAALSALARGLIEGRGQVEEKVLTEFYRAGFKPDQVLEAIAIVGASAITNYVANVTNPPLEDVFQKHQWKPTNL